MQKDKKRVETNREKEIIQKKYESAKDEWIGTINLNSTLGKNRDFSENESSDMTKYGMRFFPKHMNQEELNIIIEYARQQLKSDL